MSELQFGEFRIYPRGFLGARLEPVLERKTNKTVPGLQYDISLFNPSESKTIVANVAIEDLYAAHVRNEPSTGKFDFREKALIQILAAFGTMNFEFWYKTQYQSPSFGQQHIDFLDDTFRFIMTGKRRVSITNWDAIVDASDKKVFNNQLPDNARVYFNRTTVEQLGLDGQRWQANLVDVVQDWMRRPSGFADLLTTAHILFGIKL